MKTLSVRQPWAFMLTAGIKSEEFRSWKTSFRGPILIAASKTIDRAPYDQFLAELTTRKITIPEQLTTLGAVIGQVTISDCIPDGDGFAFIIRDPFLARSPHIIKGRLGLYNSNINPRLLDLFVFE